MTTAKLSRKRKADAVSAHSDSDSDLPRPSAKRVSSAGAVKSKMSATGRTPIYNADELAKLSHADLVAHAIALQKRLDAKVTASSTSELTSEELAKKVDQLRTLMERQIRKSMTWKPSCKTGTATFSQDFIVPSDQILKRLFQRVVKEDGKVWKMKKFSIDDFETVVGESIEASVHYDKLVLTGDITVRWNSENGTMKCSGKYGKWGTGPAFLTTAADDEDE